MKGPNLDKISTKMLYFFTSKFSILEMRILFKSYGITNKMTLIMYNS